MMRPAPGAHRHQIETHIENGQIRMTGQKKPGAAFDSRLLRRAQRLQRRCPIRARLDFEYEVVREKTGEVLTTGKSTNTYTDMNTGRIVRLPAERLEKLVSLSEGDR